MYKVGDRVVRVNCTPDNNPNYQIGVKATIVELDAYEKDMDCMVLTENGIKTIWNYEYLVPEEIWNSPLFQAMREE